MLSEKLYSDGGNLFGTVVFQMLSHSLIYTFFASYTYISSARPSFNLTLNSDFLPKTYSQPKSLVCVY